MEGELRTAAPIDLRSMMQAVRDPASRRIPPVTGRSRRSNPTPPGNELLWIAPTGSVTSPFIPYRIGVQRIAPQFGNIGI
ncbi:MAG: hypothetical protein CM15mP103_08450 [Gammaproteobacteria bacterium]|nr:MAG: hypothetical protein CM15mP103_08450 [Gammaproteobacteria bacterium]